MERYKSPVPPGTKFSKALGYVQVVQPDGSLRSEHVMVWERAHGPIPPGYHIHHIDKDPSNNRLENLMCVDPVTHRRLDLGHWLVDGVWHKRCSGDGCDFEGPDAEFSTKKIVDGVRHTRGTCWDCERCRIRIKSRRRRAAMASA